MEMEGREEGIEMIGMGSKQTRTKHPLGSLKVGNLRNELLHHLFASLLPLELQLLRILLPITSLNLAHRLSYLLSSHKHSLLLVLHLTADVVTSYSSPTATHLPTTSVHFLYSSILYQFANVSSSHTTTSHDVKLVSGNTNHLADDVLSFHHGVVL